MTLEELAIAFTSPRLVSPHSAWVEHIPFALSLIDMLRPATLVELGTHMGDSYCAFCQAVDLLEIPCACAAVDSWTGDAQAGHYDQGVLETLRRHHDPLYGRFSRLLQMTFDQAAAEFLPHSIDLLHLDGLHTHQAVQHDFTTWLPKVSARGVVLFHDTQVRARDFGVWKLWEQLAPRYPSFEFTHGYGLGVLCVGTEVPRRTLDFVHYARANPGVVRQFFSLLGQRLLLARGLRDLQPAFTGLAGLAAARRPAEAPLPPGGLPAMDLLRAGGEVDLKAWLDAAIALLGHSAAVLGDAGKGRGRQG
jgi:hypothetical protein